MHLKTTLENFPKVSGHWVQEGSYGLNIGGCSGENMGVLDLFDPQLLGVLDLIKHP